MTIRLRHVTQLGQGKPNLCGQASVAMLTNAAYGTEYTARQVAERSGTYDGTFTTAAELVKIAGQHGLRATYRRPADMAWWAEALARGETAVALVRYGELYGTAEGFGHFCVPVGMNDGYVLVHDPLKADGPTAIELERFAAAIGTASDGNTYTHQAWVLEAANVVKRGMGWNVSLGNTTAGALEEFVQMCEATNPAALTLVNDHGDDKFAYQALDIQKRLPSTRIVYRRTVKHPNGTADNTQDVITPERWVQMHLMFRNTPVYCMVNNEPRMDPGNLPDIDKTVAWHLKVAQLARFNGIKSSHVGFSAGAPHESLYSRWDPLLRYMAANPGWFQIDVHEYIRALWCHELAAGAKQPSQWPTAPNTRPLWLLGRYRRWIDRCRAIGIECPPIFISEWGWDATGAVPPEVYGNTKGLPSCLPVWESWGVGDPETYGAEQMKAAWRVLYQHEPKVVGVCFFMYTDHADYWPEFNARPFDRFVQATREGFDTMASNPGPAPVEGYPVGAYRLNHPGKNVNLRAGAGTGASIVGQLKHGDALDVVSADVTEANGYGWQEVSVPGVGRCVMATVGGAWTLEERSVDAELLGQVKDARDLLTAVLRAAGME